MIKIRITELIATHAKAFREIMAQRQVKGAGQPPSIRKASKLSLDFGIV
jgi:hypothetical protein